MEHLEASQVLQDRYPRILEDFRHVLALHGLEEFHINSVEFLHVPGFRLTTSNCPPGTVPVQKCVIKPGGIVHCFTTCSK